MSERGSAVLSALAGITMSTLIALSTLALGFSAMNTLVIRDAAIDAAQRSALAQGGGQKDYLLKLLDERLPAQAIFEIKDLSHGQLTGYQVRYFLPGLGMFPGLNSEISAVATREALS